MGNPFRGKTVVTVSSVIYNLAGDIDKLGSFIQKAVFQSVFNETNPQIAESITSSILTSKGFNLRHYMTWMDKSPNGKKYKELMGYDASEIAVNQNLVEETLAILLKPDNDTCVKLLDTEMKGRSASWFAGVYLGTEYPGSEDRDYDVDFSKITDGHQTMTIVAQIPDNNNVISEQILTVTLPYYKDNEELLIPLYKKNTKYIYAKYQTYPCIDGDNNNEDDDWKQEYYLWEQQYGEAYEAGNDGIPMPPRRRLKELLSPRKYFIYMQGSDSNSDFEDLFPSPTRYDQTLLVPPIPYRLNNKQLSEKAEEKFTENMSESDRTRLQEVKDLYRLSKLALRKVYTSHAKYKDLEKTITDNKDLGDIDYTYLFFGVPVNAKNWAAKEYLYKFFKNLHDVTSSSSVTNEFHIEAKKNYLNFSYTIEWLDSDFIQNKSMAYIKANLTNNKEPEFEPRKKYATLFRQILYRETVTRTVEGEEVTETYIQGRRYQYFLFKKVGDDLYNIVRFTNLTHKNLVYDIYEVETTIKDAFSYAKDSSGKEIYEESSFLVPIHEGIFRSMSSIKQAEMGDTFSYLIFNCYTKKRQKWYQTSDFLSFFNIVTISISVVTFMYGFAAAVAKMTEAMAQGVAATAAEEAARQTAINGVKTFLSRAVLAPLVAIVVAKGLTLALSHITNNTIANIIGSIGGMLAGMGISGMGDTTNLFEALTQAPNLIKLGLSTLNGYTQGIQMDFNESMQDFQKQFAEAQQAMYGIQEMYKNEFQNIRDWASEKFFFDLRTKLSPDQFFALTRQTGADIAVNTIEYTLNWPSISTVPYLATR